MNLNVLTPTRQRNLLTTLEQQMEIVRSLPVATPCAACVHFSRDEAAVCNKWAAVVPVEARAAGCKHWVDGEVPF